MKIKLMFNCNEATHVCDKAQYSEASFWEKTLLKFHNLFCRLCKEHTKRNVRLTETIKKSNIKMLSVNEKKALKQELSQQITQ